MRSSDAARPGDLSSLFDDQLEALRFELGDKFPVPPTELHSPSVHVETSRQKLEEVLLEHEEASPELLEELAALTTAPPLSDEELSRQALRSIDAPNSADDGEIND